MWSTSDAARSATPRATRSLAWTLFSGASRAAFRAALPLDEGTWARGSGWALWNALITLDSGDPSLAPRFGWRFGARRVIGEILADSQ